MHYILEVEGILKSFNSKQVLTDINLKCSTGEIIGILGRNGIGKSTLFRIIFGILSAENKNIRINNQIVEKSYLSPNAMKYLPQFNFLPQNSTVQQVINLYFPSEAKPNFVEDEFLKKVLNTKISDLSGGEGRYLEITMLLKSNAKFILLDEPFNGMAPILTESVKNIIINESKNKGILITDQDYNNVIELANRLYLLRDGGLKEIKSKEELMSWGYLPESK
jgi:lipopolysaccharide export system ATP-binding protein